LRYFTAVPNPLDFPKHFEAAQTPADTMHSYLVYRDSAFVTPTTNQLHEAVLLEKMIITQLLKKFNAFYRPERSITVSQEPVTGHILSQINPVHTVPLCFLNTI
jgi:hypothetical protein